MTPGFDVFAPDNISGALWIGAEQNLASAIELIRKHAAEHTSGIFLVYDMNTGLRTCFNTELVDGIVKISLMLPDSPEGRDSKRHPMASEA